MPELSPASAVDSTQFISPMPDNKANNLSNYLPSKPKVIICRNELTYHTVGTIK